MNILFAGSDAIALPTLSILHSHKLVSAVLSIPARKSGRKYRLQNSPVSDYAVANNIPLHLYESLNAQAIATLAPLKFSILVCVAYGKIFPKNFLALFDAGAFNLHPSLLPRFRGASPIAATILAGDAYSGVTVQKIIAQLDAGALCAQEKIKITAETTAVLLAHQSATLGARLMLNVVRDLLSEKPLKATEQCDADAVYCSKITKMHGKINWDMSAIHIDRLVRAMTPWPRAFTMHHGQQITIHAASVPTQYIASVTSNTPGMICALDNRYGICVNTGAGVLAIQTVQLQTRKKCDWRNFLNGYRMTVGDVFK